MIYYYYYYYILLLYVYLGTLFRYFYRINSQHRIFRSRRMPLRILSYCQISSACYISGIAEIACSHLSHSAPFYFTLS